MGAGGEGGASLHWRRMIIMQLVLWVMSNGHTMRAWLITRAVPQPPHTSPAPLPLSAVALLELRRLPSAGLVSCRAPDAPLQLVRYKRRRLALVAVEVDPDAEAGGSAAQAGGSTAGGGSSKPAAAALCGGPPKTASAYDF